jgi:hypothetical protein
MGNQSNQAKSIFLAAIDEHTAQQWPAFLERACGGDVTLRAEPDFRKLAEPSQARPVKK